FVDEALLPALYGGARLFIYPSIYEGFGLPPLEAMASGTPVVVAARSCMPEVCGDAAAYVDPDDPDQLLGTIRHSLTAGDWRTQATVRGLDRARRFTWDRCIDGTIAVYRRTLEES
ncbi:MAG TPA: glycosyltransferase, partial [Sphingomicrobium sp.]|nr:glycosyltransferase [Sphingomicrobium sp.]